MVFNIYVGAHKKVHAAIIIFTVAFGCKGRPTSDIKIQAADPAEDINEAVIQIFISEELRPHCTGSFIRANIVATAAHCIASEDNGEPFVDLAIIIDGAVYSPSKALIPEAYLSSPLRGKRRYDFGLLVFQEELSISMLDIYNEALPAELQAVEVLGYGDNSIFKVHTFSDKTIERLIKSLRIQWSHKFDMWLHPGKHSIFSKKTFRNFDYGLPLSVLVNLNGGDSGGPALLNQKIIGVASRGEDSDGYGLSSEYCSISPGSLHFEWIQAYLSGKSAEGIRQIRYEPREQSFWSLANVEQITSDRALLNENYQVIRERIISEYEQKFSLPPKKDGN